MTPKQTALATVLATTLAAGAPVAAHAQGSSQSQGPATSLVQSHTIQVNGIKIFYREAGDPKAPTILLLHGFDSSSHMFRDLMPLLSTRFHLVAPDYPGFGYSDAPAAGQFDPTFANLTDVVEKFVVQAGLKSFVIYMQDFGGPVGFRLAVKHPDWVSGFIIQNANAYREGIAPEQLKGIEARAHTSGPSQETLDKIVTSDFIHFMYQTGTRNPAALNPDAWTVDIATMQNPAAKHIQAALIDNYYTNVEAYPQWQAYFRKHHPKAVLVWGKNDPIFLQSGAEAFKKDLPNVEIHYFNTGHFALEEDAPGIAGAILSFFDSHR
jgi:pimeloyl-ACP methyl ester carboxylesterase